MTRYTPSTIESVRKILGGLDDMNVEIELGVPLVAKTVTDLCSLSVWPSGLILIVPHERYPESVVKVERGSS